MASPADIVAIRDCAFPIVVAAREDDYCSAHPTSARLVIEVAVTSLPLDQAKAAVYAAGGVEEYWIVRPAERMIEVFRTARGDGYAERSEHRMDEGMLTCAAVPALALAAADFLG